MTEKTKNRNLSEPCVLFAVETSFAADLIDSCGRLGLEIAAGILTFSPGWSLRGIPVVLQPLEVSPLLLSHSVVLCSPTPATREKAYASARDLGFSRFSSLIDPTANISGGILKGRGVYVNASATLGGEVELDDFVTVNRAASVGHHTVLEAFATVGPGATIASHCRIGKGVMIGTGAVIAPSVNIGDGATIAAGAVVFRDVEAGATVLGNPARLTRPSPDSTAVGS